MRNLSIAMSFLIGLINVTIGSAKVEAAACSTSHGCYTTYGYRHYGGYSGGFGGVIVNPGSGSTSSGGYGGGSSGGWNNPENYYGNHLAPSDSKITCIHKATESNNTCKAIVGTGLAITAAMSMSCGPLVVACGAGLKVCDDAHNDNILVCSTLN